VTGEVSGGKSASKQIEYSLLTVSDPNVLLWSVKPSEEGMENGLIARFWNMGSAKSNPEISLSHQIGSAWQTTHIETNENQLKPLNGTLSVSFNPYQIKTFRLLP
jgi:alpha-mannosidase